MNEYFYFLFNLHTTGKEKKKNIKEIDSCSPTDPIHFLVS